MITTDTLSEMLRGVNVKRLAAEADVATRTIYRLRLKQNVPSLDTAQRLVDAIDRIRARDARRKKARG
jgi:hypothetical protein